MSEREDRLYDALKQLVGWVEEGCHDAGRQYVLTEARAALKGIRSVPKDRLPSEYQVGARVHHKGRGYGIVRKVDDCVRIEFDDYPGKVSAAFDGAWFRIHPALMSIQPPT